jgi:hypothetical protein
VKDFSWDSVHSGQIPGFQPESVEEWEVLPDSQQWKLLMANNPSLIRVRLP